MNSGRIVEQGSHAELMERRSFYYDLYASQFVNALEEVS
jgi:ABC-type multidrug transport system fused ATPase/permease subunit